MAYIDERVGEMRQSGFQRACQCRTLGFGRDQKPLVGSEPERSALAFRERAAGLHRKADAGHRLCALPHRVAAAQDKARSAREGLEAWQGEELRWTPRSGELMH